MSKKINNDKYDGKSNNKNNNKSNAKSNNRNIGLNKIKYKTIISIF